MTKARASAWADAPLDAETRLTSDHHQSLRVWLRMLACTNLIGNHVRQKLQAQFGITLPRFDLMAQLERAPQGLKMGELTRRLMVTGGNVTGITDMLEEEGLVARTADPDDQRASRVKLTKAGEQQFQRMAARTRALGGRSVRRSDRETENSACGSAHGTENERHTAPRGRKRVAIMSYAQLCSRSISSGVWRMRSAL